MDQGDERLDEVFEDERDETQGWYFDLPSGAWERQEQTNRRLRETLLNRSGDDDDIPRDPFTGQPISGRKRFGLRRRKDSSAGAAKAPRFQKRGSNDEPVSEFERWRGENDDWSTEPDGAPIDEAMPLRPRNRAADEPVPQEPDEQRPRSRWEEMFGAKAGDDNLLEGMRQWAHKDAQEPSATNEDPSPAEDDEAPNVVRHRFGAHSDVASSDHAVSEQESDEERDEGPRLLRRQQGEQQEHEVEPGSRWEGAFGAAGTSAGGLGAWSDRAAAEDDHPDAAEVTDEVSSWRRIEDEEEYSTRDLAAYDSGWTQAGTASESELSDDERFVEALRQRAAFDTDGGDEPIAAPLASEPEGGRRGLFGAMRAWFKGDPGEAQEPVDGVQDETPDEWTLVDEDNDSDVEAMRAWARGDAEEHEVEAVADEAAAESSEGIEAMRAWARRDADDGEPEPVADDAVADSSEGIEAMRAWARGDAAEAAGISVERGDDPVDDEREAEVDEGIAAMRAWARGDASPSDWPEPEADDEAVADETDGEISAFRVPEVAAGGAASRVAPVLVTRHAGDREKSRRGFFGRLFGRKQEEPEDREASFGEEDAAPLAIDDNVSIDDELDEAGWVPVADTFLPGATDEPADFERLSAERRTVEGLAEDDEPSATAELLEAEGSADELVGSELDAAQEGEAAGDWAYVSGETAGEADEANADPIRASIADEDAAPPTSGPGDAAESQNAEADAVPVGSVAAEDAEDDEAPWTLVELLDDAEMLEEMLDEGGEEAALAELANVASMLEPAAPDVERDWAAPAADGAEHASSEAADDDGSVFPWAAAALTEEALEFEEAAMAAMVEEDASASQGDDAESWLWAPEQEQEEQPAPGSALPVAPVAAASFAGGLAEALAGDDSPTAIDRPADEGAADDALVVAAAANMDVPEDQEQEAEISDEELETALYLAEAYAEEATSELSAPGLASEVDIDMAAAELPGVDEEELLMRYGWEGDFDDEAFIPGFDAEEEFNASEQADGGSEPGQLRFDFTAAAASTPAAQPDEHHLVSALTGEPGVEDNDESTESSDDEPVAPGWEMPAGTAAVDDEPIAATSEAVAIPGDDDGLGWDMPFDASEDEFAEGAPGADAPAAQPGDTNAPGWSTPGDEPASAIPPAASTVDWAEPKAAETDSGETSQPEPVWPSRPAAGAGSLLSRYAAEVSAEPDPQPEAEPASAEQPADSEGAPDLWAAIAEEAASTGEQAESSEFAHPRVYGAPGQGSSLMSYSGMRDDNGDYVPDETFVAPETEDSLEDDLILRAFEAHAATEIEPEVPQEAESDPTEFDELLGEGSQELVDEPGLGEPAGVSYARLHDWPGMTESTRGEVSNSWMLADQAAPVIGGGIGAPPPNMPYADIDRPLPRDDGEASKQKTRTLVRELVETGLLALLVFLAVRASFQNFKVDGNSMYPTLEDGQFLIVNKLIYSEVDLERLGNFLPFVNAGEDPTRHVFHPPQRGDIVVLRDPSNPSVDLIKRVVGLPGDKLEIYEGAVYINDYLLEEPYITQPWHDSRPAVLIPDGHYFVLGDNRDNSKDSRSSSIGFVPEDLIIGRAELSYWPLSLFGRAPNDNPTISEARGRPVVTTQKIDRD